jgi:hypothetical protein
MQVRRRAAGRVSRRAVAVLLVVAVPVALIALYASGVVHRVTPIAAPRFASPTAPQLPVVPDPSLAAAHLNTPWFCGAAPAGVDGTGTSVVVVNPGDAPLAATITVYSDTARASVQSPITVPARGHLEQSLSALQPDGSLLGALVDIEGGSRAIVEEKVTSPGLPGAKGTAGTAVTACANDAAPSWWFADDYTLNGSTATLTLMNPYADAAIVDLTFSTNDGVRQPQALQGVPIPPHSVVAVTQDQMPKNEAVMAVTVSASRGRVVTQRVQSYLGERSGFAVSLGTPALSNEWVFADGETGDAVMFERYTVYNPGLDDVKVTSVLIGLTDASFIGSRTDTVPAGGVLSFVAREFGKVPAGRHALVASSDGGSVVVEQAITRSAGATYTTSVALGAPKAFEHVQRWSIAAGPTAPATASLVVLNLAEIDGTVTVKALGAAGETPIAGLTSLPLPNGAVTAIDLTDPALVGAPLVVESDRDIIVVRSYLRGPGLTGRTSALALPG